MNKEQNFSRFYAAPSYNNYLSTEETDDDTIPYEDSYSYSIVFQHEPDNILDWDNLEFSDQDEQTQNSKWQTEDDPTGDYITIVNNPVYEKLIRQPNSKESSRQSTRTHTNCNTDSDTTPIHHINNETQTTPANRQTRHPISSEKTNQRPQEIRVIKQKPTNSGTKLKKIGNFHTFDFQ